MTPAERTKLRQATREGFQRTQRDFAFDALGSDSYQSAKLVWFWFNHFNVFWQKAQVGLYVRSYLNDAIQSNFLGNFSNLLFSTLTHPAMLLYLDNSQNRMGRVNENYARELLELHTLGVADGYYSQSDVKEIARLLTGFRVTRPAISLQTPDGSDIERGRAVYEPNRQDPGPWMVMGRSISSSGLDSVNELVRFLSEHPGTAQNIARKLSVFVVGDCVPESLVSRAAETFMSSNGDLRKVTEFLLQASRTIGIEECPPSFTTPVTYIIRAIRWLGAGSHVRDPKPVIRWMAALGQPLFASRTPNGYSLYGRDWLSPGQLTQRIDISQEMVASIPKLFLNSSSISDVWKQPLTQLWLSRLSPRQRKTIDGARAGAERLTLLLASPAAMYRHPGDFYASA